MKTNQAVDAIRILSADAVQKANSGHPGMPLGSAPIVYELWANHMRHNPSDPNWINRDRFVLSSGHASAMLYSALHLFGYGLAIDDLKSFRQLDSLTPGHPEYGHTKGVEATTGPLGAGLGMAVGMAIAEAHLGAVFNTDACSVIDHYTYALCGDGCLMEGISSEVLSLAGTLALGKLIVLYDSNNMTIEGGTDLAFREDVCRRFEAYGFQVIEVEDGNDTAAIGQAIEQARGDISRPSFIKINTVIGYGAGAKENVAAAHGEPLGDENVAALREKLDWPHAPFDIPEDVYAHYAKLAQNGAQQQAGWQTLMDEYAAKHPELKDKLAEYMAGGLPEFMQQDSYWAQPGKADATRNISGNILNELQQALPSLIGGSADLGPSNKSVMKGAGEFSAEDYSGRNLHYGVRELGMTAIANGILLHGGLRTYVATFFVFADYMKPMLRLASLMGLPLVSILTHDSIGVGEDGPTHEPIEQLDMLRAQPNLNVFRPADEAETRAAWYSAMGQSGTPTCLVLSRQSLPALENTGKQALRGGYILEKETGESIDALIIATGSEVALAVEAAQLLGAEGKSVRVVSMPCMELFEQQDEAYRRGVIGQAKIKVAIEAASGQSWGRYIGSDGLYITMDGYGASAPASQLFEKYGFTARAVVDTIKVALSIN